MNFNITKTVLTLKEAIDFINGVAYAGFLNIEDESVQYNPFFQKLAIKSNFLAYYTDYQVHENVEIDYEAFANLDLESDCNTSQIYSSNQFKDILESIDEKVEHIKSQVIFNTNSNVKAFEDLFALYLSPLVSKMKEMCEKESRRIVQETKALVEAENLSKAQTKQITYLNAVNENFTPAERAMLEKSMADKNVDMNDFLSTLTDKYFNRDKQYDDIEQRFDKKYF